MSVVGETFSIRRTINQIISETSLNDPREIAEKVAAMIPPEEQVRLLANLLVAEVRTALGVNRNNAMGNVFQNRNTPTPPVFKPVPAVHGNPTPRPVANTPHRRKARSPKVDGIRDWWAETLRASVHVGESKWMALGECTARELEYAEKHRRDLAERETNRAKMYFALRLLLEEYKVEKVAQLPENAARAAMS